MNSAVPISLGVSTAIREHSKQDLLTKHTVSGLRNLDPESEQYRPFKQLVERLNRTYKFHTRPRAGFKHFYGAVRADHPLRGLSTTSCALMGASKATHLCRWPD